ncbi:MAG: hypothetical protein KJ939_03860 [Nanoarchaeota archaeon]|nr:hypothetical protein [Nanoarchaeota archaeon]
MEVDKGFATILALIFAGLIAICTLNGFLYSIDNIQRWDYILVNALLLIFIYLLYLTYDIHKLKKEIRIPKQKEKMVLFKNKKGQIELLILLLIFIFIVMYVILKSKGG